MPEQQNPYQVNRYIPANTTGDDPFYISRIDARENLILSLPGDGRLTFQQRVKESLFDLPSLELWEAMKSKLYITRNDRQSGSQ